MFVNQKKLNVRKETQTLNKNQRKILQLENRVLELDIEYTKNKNEINKKLLLSQSEEQKTIFYEENF